MPEDLPSTAPRAARRRPTILDVAAEAGVSKGLVSKVLSGSVGPSAATTERVLAIADRLGYRKDRSATLLAKRRTRMIGLTIIPSNIFHGELVEEIQALVDEAGYDTVLGAITGRHDEQRAIETLVDYRCEALILLGPHLADHRLAPLLTGIPTVCVGRPLAVPEVDVVRSDDEQGFADLVDHLVALGHRQIVHVDGGPGAISAVRRRAYRSAMRRHQLVPRILTGGLGEQDGAAALDSLRTLRDVTAVLAFNDRTAIGVMDRLERQGVRVPAEVSVSGFDDSLTAKHLRIDLTTVNQSHREQARLAVRAAIQRLDEGVTERREIVLPARLVVRGSTAAPRSGQAPGPA
jgi:DNA-binding LacI/PurR family transcriptional regulator